MYYYRYLPLAVCLIWHSVCAQYCPASPIHLLATDQPQWFTSPGYDDGLYPNNLDCSWLITTKNVRRRLYLQIDDSEMDAPLFSVCDDYCAVYDGNTDISTEISRWCGKKKPYGFISSSDSLYIVFHTDDRFQGRGVKISFTEYEVPGCPTGWLPNSNLRTCYSLQSSLTGFTWMEAQALCAAQKSNLLTITSHQEYAYIIDTFTRNQTIFWTGYSDAADEATFKSIDTSERIWPDQFPVFPKKHDREDCVYMNPYSQEGIAYEVASCVSKFSYVCKMRQDGQTIPFMIDVQTIRKGMVEYSHASVQWPLIILCLLFIVACLAALWYIYRKCQEKRSKQRVSSVEDAGRLVTVRSQQKKLPQSHNQQQGGSVSRPNHITDTYSTNENISSTDQKRAADHVSRFLETFERDLEGNCDTPRTSEQMNGLDQLGSPLPKPVLEPEREMNTTVFVVPTEEYRNIQSTRNSSTVAEQQKYIPPESSVQEVRQRTTRNYTITNSHPNHQQPIRERRSSLFGRPRVALLENTSAISLDEFWNNPTS